LFSFGRAPTGNREERVDKAKPFAIPKREVWEAFKRVKANQGAAGVDGQSILEFEADLSRNLYKLWNRLSSGSYFPPPVKRVMIPKRDGGGERALGIPTVADRVAQEVARRYLEPILEPVFHADSYGYRPGKSAIDAVRKAAGAMTMCSTLMSKAFSTTSIGRFSSRRSGIIQTVLGFCSTSSVG
jgi:retron-type reverse transcriptase